MTTAIPNSSRHPGLCGLFLHRSCWLLAVLLLSAVFLRADSTAFAHEDSDLVPDDAVRWGVLDNGLRYALLPNAEPPGRVSLRLFVGAGSLHETDQQQGLAHFLEHMAFKGSENFSPGELIAFLQRLGMAFGPDTNAHTGFDETVYKLDLPGNEWGLVGEGLQVLRDTADKLLLPEDEIELERGVILAEKRDRDSASYRRTVALWRFLLPDSLIPQRFPIGLREVIETAERPLFEDFYHTWYRADNMALIAAGDFDPEAMAEWVQKRFGDLAPAEGEMSDVDMGHVSDEPFAAHLHSDPEMPVTRVSLFFLRPFEVRDDSAAVRRERLLLSIAMDAINRRLDRLGDADDAPFTDGRVFAFDFMDFVDVGGIELVTTKANWRESLTLAENTLRQALEFGITEAELAEASASILTAARNAAEAAPTRRTRVLSDALMRSIADNFVFTHPRDDLVRIQQTLETITTEAVHAALKAQFADTVTRVFVSGDWRMEQAESALADAYQAASGKTVEAPEMADLAPWPYADWGQPGRLVMGAYHADLDVYQWTFANGLRLNVKQTDFEAGRVRVALRIGEGALLLDADSIGLALLAGVTFSEGGLGAYTRDELERVLAGRTVGLGFAVDADAFRFGSVTTADDLPMQLELFAAYLTDFALREEAFRRAERRLEPLYRELRTTVSGVLSDAVARAVANDDFRFGYPPLASVLQHDREAVRAFLAPAMASAYLELSVVGDIDPQLVYQAAARTLAALPERAAEPVAMEEARAGVRFREDRTPLAFAVENDLPQALGLVFWPTTDLLASIEESRRMNVLANIVRDRLRIRIRDEMGAAYSPSARNSASEVFEGFGFFQVLNGADRGSALEMAKLMRDTVTDVREGGVSEDDLERALRPLLSFLQEHRRDNGYWLNRVLFASQAQPSQLDWARSIVSDYEAIERAEIEALAQKYLDPDAALIVTIEPSGGAEEE